jgi:hypothetical protein
LEAHDFTSYLSVNNFVKKSILNDSDSGASHNGILRLNRFVGVLDIKMLKKLDKGSNNNVEKLGHDFFSWNIFKINCPSLKFKMEDKEMDGIPRHYIQSWVYDDLEISFLESSDMKFRHYFFEWMESALSTATSSRRYYEDVMSRYFIIYPLNAKGVPERYEVFYNLIPTEIGSVDYDVSDEGTAVVLTKVKFRYIGHKVLSFKE